MKVAPVLCTPATVGAVRVVVIGAGPSGAAASMELSRCGVECILVERKSLPRTKACGSGLSPWTLNLLDTMGVGQKVRAQAFRIDGAAIAGATGEAIELRGDHETAILRRSELDYLLVQESVRLGTELLDDTTVKDIEVHRLPGGRHQVGIRTSAGNFEADLVIDCSGATGKLDRKTSFSGAPQDRGSALDGPLEFAQSLAQRVSQMIYAERYTLHTIMGWYEGVAGCSDVVELFFDQELRPHYAWVFPETERRVNIGLCFLPVPGGPNARQHFESFLDRRLHKRLKHAELLGKWIGHPVQVSAAAQELISDGVLRAGEAGWLADASTAEGIYHGLLSGRVAGQFAAQQLLTGSGVGAHSMRTYQKKVQRDLLPRLALGRGLMGVLGTPVLDWALSMKSSAVTQKALSKAFTGLYHG